MIEKKRKRANNYAQRNEQYSNKHIAQNDNAWLSIGRQTNTLPLSLILSHLLSLSHSFSSSLPASGATCADSFQKIARSTKLFFPSKFLHIARPVSILIGSFGSFPKWLTLFPLLFLSQLSLFFHSLPVLLEKI